VVDIVIQVATWLWLGTDITDSGAALDLLGAASRHYLTCLVSWGCESTCRVARVSQWVSRG
jgi:hypothetical protein